MLKTDASFKSLNIALFIKIQSKVSNIFGISGLFIDII